MIGLFRIIHEEHLIPREALARLGYLDAHELEFATRHMNNITRMMECEGILDTNGWYWLKGL